MIKMARRHERISSDPGVMGGKPCIRGTRVPIDLILRQLGNRQGSRGAAFAADAIDPLHDGIAPGAVVHPWTSSWVSPNMITLCPRVAEALGWPPDPLHAFDYLDEIGQVTATTCYWRDGGELSQQYDTGVARQRYILTVRDNWAEKIGPYLETVQVSRAWRATQSGDGHSREVYCGQPRRVYEVNAAFATTP